MPTNHTVTTYTYEELDAKAQERARDWWREQEARSGDLTWAQFTIEDAETIAGMLGIELQYHAVKLYGGGTRQDPNIWWSVSYCQGDGACFEGRYSYAAGCVRNVKQHAPNDVDLHAIAINLQTWQQPYGYKLVAGVNQTSGSRGCHEHSVTIDVDTEGTRQPDDETIKGITEQLRAFMRWIHRALVAEYEYQTADAQVADMIIGNEYQFTKEGARSCLS